MEITIKEIMEKTKLSKKQILNCEDNGLIPPRIRIDKKGRGGGDIIIFDIEALNQLMLICNSTLWKSIVPKMGIEGMTWLLFVRKIDDNRLNESMRSVMLKAFLHFKEQRIIKNAKIKNVRNIFLDKVIPPIGLIKLFILKSDDNISEEKLDEKFSTEISKYQLTLMDKTSDWAKFAFDIVKRKFNINYSDDDVDIAFDYAKKFIICIPKFSEVERLIKNMDENDFYLYRLVTILLWVIVSFTIKKKDIVKRLKSQSLHYTLNIAGLYFMIFYKFYKEEIGYKVISILEDFYENLLNEKIL